MLSVNTNQGAMTALQYLNKTNSDLQAVENAVNSGQKVASAKDNGAVYAIAQNMRGNVAGYNAVTDSLNRGTSVVDTALSAAQTISDLLIQMKQNATSATDTSLDTASRTQLANDFRALSEQITTIVTNASFNGINLVDGNTNNVSALATPTDTSQRITVLHQTMTLAALKITGTYSDAGTASNMVSTLSNALSVVNSSLSSLSAGAKKFSIQTDFVSKMIDALNTGIGNLVDANMAQESARLTALQTKQQLGVQALTIANQAPQAILSLFK
jgi:flagellin